MSNLDKYRDIFKKKADEEELISNIKRLASYQANAAITTKSVDHSIIVLSEILNHSHNTVNFLTTRIVGSISDSEMFLNSLEKFLARGGSLNIALIDPPDQKDSRIFNLLSKYPQVKVKGIKRENVKNDDSLKTPYHFMIGDQKMYRMELDAASYVAVCNFNDPVTCDRLLKLFENNFSASEDILHINELYTNSTFKSISRIIIPDFEHINIELFEYFSKNPDKLERLEPRKFEIFLGEIFKNQGYLTELGPGWGDGGIDLRLIQKDSVGQIITLVQAKRYKKENKIRIEAVQALTALVDSQKANRGLFVTTSEYLPGVKKWADTQPTKIVLANSEDVAKWCSLVIKKV